MDARWPGFEITPDADNIVLRQIGPKSFELGSAVTYSGDTGLSVGDDVESVIRHVDPNTLRHTDLASVPGPLRWWINTYGQHTPAALIHDRLIGETRPDGITEEQADRYFRFMLKSLGLPFFRRWLMWAAVATRTRFMSAWWRRGSLFLWLASVVCAYALVVAGVRSGDQLEWVTGVGLLSGASALWGRQIGAGLIIALVGVPALLPPVLLVVVSVIAYSVLEGLGEAARELWERRRGASPT